MNKKILVVDDDTGILEALEIMLESAGYEAKTSADWQYLQKIENTALPDLILLDILLSGKDGRELCKELKSKEKTKNIPVIMLSAHPTAGNEFKKYGANDFLKKPFEMNLLLEKIAVYLKV
jgi:DNA-binding response OmpR family regulator